MGCAKRSPPAAQASAALKKETKASTSCGGCGPLVKQILDGELKKRGVEVKNHLCEHFKHSRQELFHLTRFGNLRTFDAVIAKHGQGRGCDICKPAVASILAACWNEMILKPKHAPLQDTNDHFLANLQKDGTYSVVPRVPGGEITPEKLIVLGQVAKKFGLYTKITGAQRIDLFGARVEQLPHIWKDLVDAGFESGHAYGKAVRTVKSCVGSTWCRYGVQDSVSMAIRIEERYRGVRSPHKLKMAVSGCTRECAEAQGKDVGVIATEKGWNLYVCGNGGMQAAARGSAGERSRRRDADSVHRSIPDVLHPHGRPVTAHQHVAGEPGRRHRVRAQSRVRRLARHRPRARSRHAEARGHLRVRMEEERSTIRRF